MEARLDTSTRYGPFAIALHWAMAVLLVALLALGWTMVSLPDVGYDTRKITLILVHKAMGMVALALVALRLSWRLRRPLPPLAGGLPQWQQVAARLVHLLFYALMFALPLTGWVMSSAGGYPIPFFGWFDVPDITGPNEWLFHRSIEVHRWLAWSLAALLVLHAGAAVHHHFVVGDDTLRKMLPD
ncbi:cytochrome b [Ramlibacter sp. USB13]|uniref:Cytochrome b n=1 Tax=Ramlibacter cellulosilyticus TaxID=2764187 RepID=A0A923MTB3_9BURK|nr:cytochrome b [Ramlibacter cellulosilyticus]MBC5785030.1 cytochrome b [Ramlibacter cellulosilyticus]